MRPKHYPGDTTTVNGVTLKIVRRAGRLVRVEIGGEERNVKWCEPLEMGGEIFRLYPTATGGVWVLSDEETR